MSVEIKLKTKKGKKQSEVEDVESEIGKIKGTFLYTST